MINFSDMPSNSHIHFIGIGGISMSGLAHILLKKGFNVSGSDRSKSHITDKLEKLGAKIYIGHDEENIKNADLAVYTAAVHDDNAEIKAAKKQKIPLISRAECLGAIMKEYKHAIGISGTHGKTTTTSMLAHALIFAGKDPTVSVGGELDIIDGNIRVGNGDFFITEACEYTNSFLKLYPSVALITNIEADHLDFFKDVGEIIESFRKFALLTLGKGYVVALGSDPNVKKALENTGCNIITYGLEDKYDYYAHNIVYTSGFPQFDVFCNGKKICHINLNVPGTHNVLNALAAVAACSCLDIDAETAAEGIESFRGTHRRFEHKGSFNGAAVFDDYAHHPTEIKATLSAAASFEHNRLWCIFQPHTYTRTKTLWGDFVKSFDFVDELIITDIYAARELPDGVTKAENLAAEIAKHGVKTRFVKNFSEICTLLRRELKKDDMVITMGAGDVVKIGEELVNTSA
ncbi:MAG: UDP-N-acetylmuramate--L-alanine ligase [Clostridia bacterium]|nr:UDP-N-acetylmuramate--L-alanine ligase [Clostridia bacterium]